MKISLFYSSVLFAASTIFCGPVHAESPTVGYWRFEGGPTEFLGSSGTLPLPLTIEAGTGEPRQAALSGNDAGAAFSGGKNRAAARFVGEEGGCFVVEPNDALHLQEFTVEALINLAGGNSDSKNQVIVASGAFDESGGSWMLSVTGETSSRGARHLVFSYQFAPGPWATENRVAIDSGLQLKKDTDYFVAVAFNAADSSKNGLVFYLQDLTNKSAMETVFRPHPNEASAVVANGEGLRIGNLKAQKISWDGLIDEVRVSNRLLSESELLINQPAFP